jgi:hypothetical protein
MSQSCGPGTFISEPSNHHFPSRSHAEARCVLRPRRPLKCACRCRHPRRPRNHEAQPRREAYHELRLSGPVRGLIMRSVKGENMVGNQVVTDDEIVRGIKRALGKKVRPEFWDRTFYRNYQILEINMRRRRTKTSSAMSCILRPKF